jgi:hypothetical protein
MFIVHKEMFYAHYATWSDRKQAYVVEFLKREYQVDREGARAALFGPEPGMDNRPRVPVEGPWGSAVGRRR